MTKRTLYTFLAASLVLASCGDPADRLDRRPDVSVAENRDGVITGAYNQSRFNAQMIQARIRGLCTDRNVVGYGETTRTDGFIAYQATCASGSVFDRSTAIIRQDPDGTARVEIIGF